MTSWIIYWHTLSRTRYVLQKKYFWRMTSSVHLAKMICELCKSKKFGGSDAETHGAGSPARRLSSIAFLSAEYRQNVSKATVGRSEIPFMVIGSASVASFAAPLTDTDSETLIGFCPLLCGVLSSEGFLRMAGILCHVSIAGDKQGLLVSIKGYSKRNLHFALSDASILCVLAVLAPPNANVVAGKARS